MHVTFATDNAYAPLTAVAMYSVCEAVPDVNVTVLADGLDDTACKNLARTLRNHPDVTLDIVDIADLLAPLELLPVEGRFRAFPRSIWATLFLGAALPSGLRRTVYLDSDVIVRRDPTELWRLDLDGNVVAAVLSGNRKQIGGPNGISYHRELGLSPDLCPFNSGVFLADLDAWRRDEITFQCLEVLRKFHHRVISWDQEVLNAVLAGRWLPLSTVWNCTDYWRPVEDCQPPYADDLEHAVIRHFAGYKPWDETRPVPHRDEFHRLASRTGTTDGRSWIS
jgi:lipopolysaccharide biosynthesis glycosyltransferase